jgi:hypothetical protein
MFIGITQVCTARLALRLATEALWVRTRLLMHRDWMRDYPIDPVPDFRLLDLDQHKLGFFPVLKLRIL